MPSSGLTSRTDSLRFRKIRSALHKNGIIGTEIDAWEMLLLRKNDFHQRYFNESVIKSSPQ